MLPACAYTCPYTRVCSSVPVFMDQSGYDALRRRREMEREHRARETPEQRAARLNQRRLRGRKPESFHTLPSCDIDAKSSQRKNSRLYISWHSLRSSIPDRRCLYLFPIFVVLRFKLYRYSHCVLAPARQKCHAFAYYNYSITDTFIPV